MRCQVVCFVAALSVSSFGYAEDSASILKKLQGEWIVVSISEDGKPEPEAEIKKYNVSVKADKMIVRGDGGERILTMKIDPAKTPIELDVTVTEGKNDVTEVRAICKLDGDTFTLCGTDKPKDRPKEFAGGKDVTLIVLKRKS